MSFGGKVAKLDNATRGKYGGGEQMSNTELQMEAQVHAINCDFCNQQ